MNMVWRALALRDLTNIHAHIARYSDPAHAYEALANIRIQINALADQPGMGRAGRKPGTRYIVARYHGQTYRVTYRVRAQTVIILRVRDTRQKDA